MENVSYGSYISECSLLMEQWDYENNTELSPEQVKVGAMIEISWHCKQSNDHKWKMAPRNRIYYVDGCFKLVKCPFCYGRRPSVTNCLIILFPEIVEKLWDYTKNITSPYDVTPYSSKNYYWVCKEGPDHQWISSPANIVTNYLEIKKRKGSDSFVICCPYCNGKKVSVTNCLETMYPMLSRQWDYSKNLNITPKNILAGSNKIFSWKCSAGPDHVWLDSPKNRVTCLRQTKEPYNLSCPFCNNRRVSITNCLSTVFPHLVPEWDTQKNSIKPHEILSQSHTKLWWRCEIDTSHSWYASPNERRKNGCPHCSLSPRSIPEILIMFELKKFVNIDENKHKIRLNKKYLDLDIIISDLKVIIEFDGSIGIGTNMKKMWKRPKN